jgi:hypothetical protein
VPGILSGVIEESSVQPSDTIVLWLQAPAALYYPGKERYGAAVADVDGKLLELKLQELAFQYTWCVQKVSNLWSAEIYLLIWRYKTLIPFKEYVYVMKLLCYLRNTRFRGTFYDYRLLSSDFCNYNLSKLQGMHPFVCLSLYICFLVYLSNTTMNKILIVVFDRYTKEHIYIKTYISNTTINFLL